MLAGDELLVSDQKNFTAYIHISENLKDYMELTGFITRRIQEIYSTQSLKSISKIITALLNTNYQILVSPSRVWLLFIVADHGCVHGSLAGGSGAASVSLVVLRPPPGTLLCPW
jgi:hypothetical protein